jgi:hypothetical protein
MVVCKGAPLTSCTAALPQPKAGHNYQVLRLLVVYTSVLRAYTGTNMLFFAFCPMAMAFLHAPREREREHAGIGNRKLPCFFFLLLSAFGYMVLLHALERLFRMFAIMQRI